MSMFTSRVRADGDSLSITIPAEVARRMEVAPGDDLLWVDDGIGGYRVTASNPQRAETLRAHAEIIEEHSDVFRKLAQ